MLCHIRWEKDRETNIAWVLGLGQEGTRIWMHGRIGTSCRTLKGYQLHQNISFYIYMWECWLVLSVILVHVMPFFLHMGIVRVSEKPCLFVAPSLSTSSRVYACMHACMLNSNTWLCLWSTTLVWHDRVIYVLIYGSKLNLVTWYITSSSRCVFIYLFWNEGVDKQTTSLHHI